MTLFEKMVWSAAYVKFLSLEDIDKVGAIRAADTMVMMLRARIKCDGVLHTDEDLELERKAEQDTETIGDPSGYRESTPFQWTNRPEDIQVDIGNKISQPLSCLKECEKVIGERCKAALSSVRAGPETNEPRVYVSKKLQDYDLEDILWGIIRKYQKESW